MSRASITPCFFPRRAASLPSMTIVDGSDWKLYSVYSMISGTSHC